MGDLITTSIFIGLVMSIIASIVFTFAIYLLRPRVAISEKIAYRNGTYKIKVVNKSIFKLIDVHAELLKVKPTEGKNVILHRINLTNNKIWFIGKSPWSDRRSRWGSHAVTFSVSNPIEVDKMNQNEWVCENGEFLHFKIIAKHGLSSFQKVETMKYHNRETDIVSGRFNFGKDLSIN